MSHGQATRSTFTCSRVIHFMALLLGLAVIGEGLGEPAHSGGLALRTSLPERFAGGPLGFFARDSDVFEQPIIEVQQSLALTPAIVHLPRDRPPSEREWHASSRWLDDGGEC